MACTCLVVSEIIKWFSKAVLLRDLPPAVTERPSCSRSPPTLGTVVFFLLALLGYAVISMGVPICFALRTKDVKHLFTCSLTNWLVILGKCLFNSCPFFIQQSVFFLLRVILPFTLSKVSLITLQSPFNVIWSQAGVCFLLTLGLFLPKQRNLGQCGL